MMWEYKVEVLDDILGRSKAQAIIDETLSSATLDGWELVSTSTFERKLYLFFKRPFNIGEYDRAVLG